MAPGRLRAPSSLGPREFIERRQRPKPRPIGRIGRPRPLTTEREQNTGFTAPGANLGRGLCQHGWIRHGHRGRHRHHPDAAKPQAVQHIARPRAAAGPFRAPPGFAEAQFDQRETQRVLVPVGRGQQAAGACRGTGMVALAAASAR